MPETTATKKATAKRNTTRIKPVAKTAKPAQPARAVRVRDFRPDEYVTVRNGYDGCLIYRSSKTGEKFVFENFGDTHDIEIQELKKARNDAKAFFRNGWFLIDDPDVITYLGLGEYYKNAFTYEDFDKLAEMTPEEISEKIAKVSPGQRETIAHRARTMIADGRIDSHRAIAALEQGLGVQLNRY